MLLQAIQDADFETYVKLTDSSITCFEPEAVSFPSHGELLRPAWTIYILRIVFKMILVRLHS